MNAPVSDNVHNEGVTDAVKLVGVARHVLLHATWRLDDAGYECPALNGIYADTAELIANWSGRRRPTEIESVPALFVEAAREYRRLKGRSY